MISDVQNVVVTNKFMEKVWMHSDLDSEEITETPKYIVIVISYKCQKVKE